MKPILFLKWFFGVRGVMKVPPTSFESQHIYNKIYNKRRCVVCGDDYWVFKIKKNPSQVCTMWQCYRDYHRGFNNESKKIKLRSN